MIFKTTLAGSNPRIIREFYMEGTRTVGELLSIIAIVHGWPQDAPLKLVLGEKEMTSSLSVQTLGHNQERIQVIMPMQERKDYWGHRMMNEEKWIFRLEIVSEEESVDKGPSPVPAAGPRLLRFRGMNPSRTCDSLENWNTLHRRLVRSGDYHYGYGYRGKREEQGELLVNPKRINRLLYRRLVCREEEIHLSRACCHSFEDILNSYTVDILKSMVSEELRKVDPYLRKRELIREIIREYKNGDRWKKILDEMDTHEYSDFQKLCRGEVESARRGAFNYPVLRQYCLRNRRYDITYIPHELLDYYEKMLMEEGEKDLVVLKKIRHVIRAASELYGVFTRSMCKQLAVIMYPKEVKPEDISLAWKETDTLQFLNKYTMFNCRIMDSFFAQSLMEDPMLKVFGYYVPSKDEAFRIADGKMNYTKEEQKVLQKCLSGFEFKHYYYYYGNKEALIDRCISLLYEMSHLGIDSAGMKDYLQESFRMEGTASQYRNLFKQVDRYRMKVRSVELHGYTEEEIRRKQNI